MIEVFGRTPAHDPAVTTRLKGWVRELLGLGEAAAVVVSELRCADADCPDVETVIAVLDAPGRRRAYKILKPLAEVTRDDLGAAMPQLTT